MVFLAAVDTAVAQVPAFEVASVRRVPAEGGRRGNPQNIQVSPDGVSIRSASLRAIVRWAYGVFDVQVSGPDWINVERYDISAKAGAAVPEEQLRVMLQGLLAERFKLAMHRQNKEFGAFVLTVGKNGPKFRESKEEGEAKVEPDLSKFMVTARRVPISQGLEVLSNILKAPVVDMTGLTGKYDVTLSVSKYVPQPGASVETFDIISTIILGVHEELGLKLESKKIPLDLLIIDHVEKVPTEN